MGTDRQSRCNMERAMRGPAWRWQLACDAARTEVAHRYRISDELTQQAAEYFQLCGQGAQHAAQVYPRIALAEKLWDNLLVRDQFKLLVVANLPSVEIAERLGIEEGIVRILEDLRYDVRPMLALASTWISAHVIMAEADQGNDHLAAQLRMAYFCGPYAARMLVDAKQGVPVAPVERLAAVATLLYAKYQQAIEMPLSPEQAPQFVELYSKIQLEERKLQLERDKLALRVQRWAQRYELAQARLAWEREEKGVTSAEPELSIHQPPSEAA